LGTKLNPGKFDCYENAAPDEPMFVLLARDPVAPILVDLWAELRDLTRGRPASGPQWDKIQEAMACAQNMREWNAAKAKDEQKEP